MYIRRNFLNIFTKFGCAKESAGAWASIILILLSAILTGFGLYEKSPSMREREHLCL